MARFLLTGRKSTWTDTVTLDRSIREKQGAGNGRPPGWLRRDHAVHEYDVHGFPCFTVGPKSPAGPQQVLFLHGGARRRRGRSRPTRSSWGTPPAAG